jgi:ATP-dependent DNA ligase
MFLFCSLPVKPPDAVAQINRATALQAASKAPSGARCAHKIKLDGYRMVARIEDDRVKLLTRSSLDWTAKVAEITYLSWPDDDLLHHAAFVGWRDDKPAR